MPLYLTSVKQTNMPSLHCRQGPAGACIKQRTNKFKTGGHNNLLRRSATSLGNEFEFNSLKHVKLQSTSNEFCGQNLTI